AMARSAGGRGAPAVVADALSKSFSIGRAMLLANDGLSFVAERARVGAIVGESGAGKSTFAHILAGLETASKGRLDFAGDDIAQTPVGKRRPDQVAAIQMVFQNPDSTLHPPHSVGWPIARALKRFGIVKDRRGVDARVKALLELVHVSAGMRRRMPRQLSGGQKQRVAIPR